MKKPKWEGSKADMKVDRAGAKKAGISQKSWEGSKADEKADRAGAKKMRKGK